MGTDLVTLISGIAAAAAVIIPTLRKTHTEGVDELRAKVTALDTEVDDLRKQLVACEKQGFKLQRLLVANGIEVP